MAYKSKKLATLLTFLGFLLIATALLYSVFQLKSIQDQIELKTAQSEQLNTKIEELNRTIDHIKNGPIIELVKPKAIAVKLEGKKDGLESRQLYNFILWTEMPNYRKKEVPQIKYFFNHSSMLKKNRISKEPTNGFAVNYTGWGSIPVVELTISQIDKPDVKIDFNMSEEIIFK
jgi:hypothetical protein